MTLGVPASVLGVMISGDVGGYTTYTDRFGRKVWYPKAPPDKPASVLQTIVRTRFKDAMTNWRNASDQVKADWEACSLKSGLAMTGLNMWLHFSLKGTAVGLATFVRQTGITLVLPPSVF